MRKFAIALCAALLVPAIPAGAHHAVNAQFDVSRLETLTGTLARLDATNPHAYWRFDVRDAQGRTQRWNLESLAPAGLRRAGIRLREDIRVGQSYTFRYAPSRNGSTTGLLLEIEINGQNYRMAPR